MSLILVVEPEERYIQRVRDALGSEGWRTRTVTDRAEALQAAASEAPNLVLVSTDLDGASALIDAFARRSGGPGVVAIVDEAGAGGASAEGMGADDLLTKPFTDQQLRLTVRRGLVAATKPAPRPAGAGAAGGPGAGARFTSADIFGDLVAEVEDELARTEGEAPGAPSPPPPAGQSVVDGPEGLSTIRIPVVPHPQPPAAPTPAAPTSSTQSPPTPPAPPPIAAPPTPGPESDPSARGAEPPPRDRDQEEIERRLEQTLSGVLDDLKKPPPAKRRPAASRAGGQHDEDVDSLLSETLTGLDLDAKTRRKQAPVVEEDPLAGLDLSGLEELSRPAGPPAAAAPPSEPQPPAPPVPEPVQEPPSAAPPPEPPAPEAIPEAVPTAAAPPAATDAEQAEPFGQYTLQERIAVGGMAEVWKARMRGVEGFQKTVAIKKILPHLTDNAEFVTMFIDEAKLAAQLNHPNIIHIYDLGKIADSYYIAMEYVAGRNLRTLLDAAGKKQWPIPAGLALLIAARLASALDYAHKKRDFDNRELGLVHRDVSPQNVLISFEGAIKLCDFGIAKAVAKASHTQMGALKGKLQYMSPEQAWGRTVDARSDIFSLGSLLFEMLTGQRLFTGDSEISVLEAVRECQVKRPQEVVADLPDAADEIVMKALAKEPEHRYQAASEMQNALEAALHGLKPTPGPAELTAYLEELSGARTVAASGGTGSRIETGTGSREAAAAAEAGTEDDVAAAGSNGSEVAAAPAATGSDAAAALDSTGFDDSSSVATPVAPNLESPAADMPGPIASLEGEVSVDEGSGRGRWLLIAAIVVAAALLVAFFVLRPQGAGSGSSAGDDSPQGVPAEPVEPPPPLLEDTLPADGEEGEGAAGEGADRTGASAAVPAATAGSSRAPVAAAAPGDDTGAASDDPGDAPDLEAMVAERLAERERELRAQREAELRRLEAELAATRDPAADDEAPPATARGEPEPEAEPGGADEPSRAQDSAAVEPPAAEPAAAAEAEPPELTGPTAVPDLAPASTPTSTPAPGRPDPPIPPPSSSPSRSQPRAAGRPDAPPATPAAAAARDPSEASQPPPEKAPVKEGQLVQPGPGVVPPKLVSIAKPEYPPVARRMRIQGDVTIAVLVDERGRVIETRFVETVRQNVGINEAALEAARSARYDPATKDGVRVKMWTNLKLPFRL